jgi:hypothetical protein
VNTPASQAGICKVGCVAGVGGGGLEVRRNVAFAIRVRCRVLVQVLPVHAKNSQRLSGCVVSEVGALGAGR